MSDVGSFVARVTKVQPHPKFLRRSTLSVRNGAGVLERILGGGKYRKVLEIGTFRGVNAAYMAQFCDRVTTIDLLDGQLERWGTPFDRRAFWASLGVSNIDLHLVADDAEKSALIKTLDFDFAFIDGDHSGHAPRRDFEMVKHCGAVLFHDYGGPNGVTPFVDSLPKDQVEIMDIFAFWRA